MLKNFSFMSVVFLKINCPTLPSLDNVKLKTQNFDSEKLAHKICAKNAQNRAKLAKMPKIAQKKEEKNNETRGKKQKIAQL